MPKKQGSTRISQETGKALKQQRDAEAAHTKLLHKSSRRLRSAANKVAASSELQRGKALPQTCNEDRITCIIQRAVYLKGINCHSHAEIAEILQQEFKLERTPTIVTISKWLTLGKAEIWFDTKELQRQLRIEQFNDLEKMKAEWFAGAMRKLGVIQQMMIKGEQVEVIDENAFMEQANCARIYLEICKRQAKLLGLDTPDLDETQKAKDPQALLLWLQNQITFKAVPEARNKALTELPGGTTLLESYGNLSLSMDGDEDDHFD